MTVIAPSQGSEIIFFSCSLFLSLAYPVMKTIGPLWRIESLRSMMSLTSIFANISFSLSFSAVVPNSSAAASQGLFREKAATLTVCGFAEIYSPLVDSSRGVACATIKAAICLGWRACQVSSMIHLGHGEIRIHFRITHRSRALKDGFTDWFSIQETGWMICERGRYMDAVFLGFKVEGNQVEKLVWFRYRYSFSHL